MSHGAEAPRLNRTMRSFGSILQKARVVDSHTGGEPTRVVVTGGPDLGEGCMAERLERFRVEHDGFRSAVVCEPRGSDVLVGALLCEPVDSMNTAGVIFFNNVGYLGMCGHGTMGLLVTLAHLGQISAGEHRIETPVGLVTATLHEDGEVTVTNVASYRSASGAAVSVPGYGTVAGDIAWGGNWFFLVHRDEFEITLANVEALTHLCWSIRQALTRAGITAPDGHEIDHVELFGPSKTEGVHSKNFVLCPGKAFDRSACGTGTSAKLACLYADGLIREGETWVQEGITGSVFQGSVRVREGRIYPSIRGSAFVTAEADLIFNPADPFCLGVHA